MPHNSRCAGTHFWPAGDARNAASSCARRCDSVASPAAFTGRRMAACTAAGSFVVSYELAVEIQLNKASIPGAGRTIDRCLSMATHPRTLMRRYAHAPVHMQHPPAAAMQPAALCKAESLLTSGAAAAEPAAAAALAPSLPPLLPLPDARRCCSMSRASCSTSASLPDCDPASAGAAPAEATGKFIVSRVPHVRGRQGIFHRMAMFEACAAGCFATATNSAWLSAPKLQLQKHDEARLQSPAGPRAAGSRAAADHTARRPARHPAAGAAPPSLHRSVRPAAAKDKV